MRPESEVRPGRPVLRWLVLAGVAAGVFVAFRYFPTGERLFDAVDWVRRQGAWAPVVFVGAYVAGCVLFLPGSALTLAAGLLFGPVLGTVWTSVGSTLGATASFLVGRFLARDWVTARVATNPKCAAVDGAVAREGWKIVLLLRLSPLFPFSLLNYALGLTRIPVLPYALASWIGMLPGTVAYVWLGSVLGEALLRGGARDRARTPWEIGLQVAGLLATLGVTWFVTRVARRALAERLPAKPGSEASQLP